MRSLRVLLIAYAVFFYSVEKIEMELQLLILSNTDIGLQYNIFAAPSSFRYEERKSKQQDPTEYTKIESLCLTNGGNHWIKSFNLNKVACLETTVKNSVLSVNYR